MDENCNKDFPFEIEDVGPELTEELLSKYTGERTGFVRVGPKGYFFPKKYETEAALYYNMPVRPSDVFVASFPRSGTTLTQEMVWLIGNDLDYKKAADVTISERFPVIEYYIMQHPMVLKEMISEFKGNNKKLNTVSKMYMIEARPAIEILRDAPSPRFIKTHLPLSLLPPALTDTARVVYVARDPRDVAVSYYHLKRLLRLFAYNGDFKTFWNYFIKDLVYWSPYFEHVKEAWQKRHDPNVLFLFYEELSKDMPNTIRKVSKFLKKSLSDEQVAKLTEHLKIDNFRNNDSVNADRFRDVGFFTPGEQPFIRKGQVGGWRDYFDEEMARQAERWIGDNLRGTDLRFPSMDDDYIKHVKKTVKTDSCTESALPTRN